MKSKREEEREVGEIILKCPGNSFQFRMNRLSVYSYLTRYPYVTEPPKIERANGRAGGGHVARAFGLNIESIREQTGELGEGRLLGLFTLPVSTH